MMMIKLCFDVLIEIYGDNRYDKNIAQGIILQIIELETIFEK